MRVRAIRVERTGPPEVMAPAILDLPPPGPGEVQVRHAAIGVNMIDVQQRAGRLPLRLPGGLGLEAAGTVASVGDGVVGWRGGDRVVYVARDPGCYAAARNVPALTLVRVPDPVGLEDAAAIFSRGLLAWHFTHTVRALGPSDAVLVHGASGVVGGLLTRFAVLAGATVIGVVPHALLIDRARLAGCHHVVLQDDDRLVAAVRDASGGGVSVVYDSIGQATFERSLDTLLPRGLMVAFGNSSGMVPLVSLMKEFGARGSLQLAWCMLRDFLTSDLMPRATAGLFSALVRGDVSVEIGGRYELCDAALAHRAIEAGEARGATVLIP